MLAAFFIACIMQVVSQEYRPMLQVGKVWHMNWPNMSWPGGEHDGKWELTVEKDTIVEGECCFKVLSQMSFRPGEEGCFLLQEKDSKVWLLDGRHASSKKLLYDFTFNVGDPVTVSEGSGMTVERIDTIEVRSGQYRRFTLFRPKSGYCDEEHQLWVEGIGSIWGPVSPLSTQGSSGFEITLDSCTVDGICIFTASDFDAPAMATVIALPTTFVNTVPHKHHLFTDLQGRPSTLPSRCGLYIRDGRKVVVR